MDISIFNTKSEQLLIKHDDDTIGFIVLTKDEKQTDFCIDLTEWECLKIFIDNSILNEIKENK